MGGDIRLPTNQKGGRSITEGVEEKRGGNIAKQGRNALQKEQKKANSFRMARKGIYH